MTKELTANAAIQELRSIAASIAVDNGGYRERLLAIANLLERLWYPAITVQDEPVTLIPPAWSRDEVVKYQAEIIQELRQKQDRLSEKWDTELARLKAQVATQQTMLDKLKADLDDDES